MNVGWPVCADWPPHSTPPNAAEERTTNDHHPPSGAAMTKPKPLTPWQERNTPPDLPHHIRRNIARGKGGCWLWTRSKSRDGYGWASLNSKTHQAHRLIYRLLRGEIPEGLVLDHLCRVRHCVNPDHLEPVTPRQNLERGETQTSATHCMKNPDHGPLAQLPTQRRCLECRREEMRARMREYRKTDRYKRYITEYRARKKEQNQ